MTSATGICMVLLYGGMELQFRKAGVKLLLKFLKLFLVLGCFFVEKVILFSLLF